MGVNIINFNKLSELVSLTSLRKPKIVLDPDGEYYLKSKKLGNGEDLNANIICDKSRWKIPEHMQIFVDSLSQNTQLSNEDKILLVFEKLGRDYIYDDNILSYIRKVDDDKFALPDWYGRDVDTQWEKSRETHNKRVCYEISRYLAKSLSELFKNDDSFSICILWDVELTHYYVGLTCKDYTITLDLDDFNNIKDLTRIKTDLTADGIDILEDNEGKFETALNRFNKKRNKHAVKQIESDINNINNTNEEEEPDDVVFLKNALLVLIEKYNLDSQGMYEYLKEIVDITLGIESREKIWKKIGENSNGEPIYTRCLVINVENKKYVIDVDSKVLRPFDDKEFETAPTYLPYKKLSRDWDERYDGM